MKFSAVALLVTTLMLAAVASAQVLYNHLGSGFTEYTTGDPIVLNGSAVRMHECIRLTPAERIKAGSAWLKPKQDIVNGFSTVFQFSITDPGDVFPPEITEDTGGDGFAFVIQGAGTDALGAPGGCIGYVGIPNSLAIEFDTWDNNESGQTFVRDVGDNHVSIHTMGVEPNSEVESLALGISPNMPWIDDGDVHTVRIEYIPGNLYVYVDDLESPVLGVQIFLDEVLELEDGQAWVGFTAATWDAYENHDILNWAFTGAATQ